MKTKFINNLFLVLILLISIICNNNLFILANEYSSNNSGSSSSSSNSSGSRNSDLTSNGSNSNEEESRLNNNNIKNSNSLNSQLVYPTNITRSYEGTWNISSGSISKLNKFEKTSGIIVFSIKNTPQPITTPTPTTTTTNNNTTDSNNNNSNNNSENEVPQYDIIEGVFRIRDGNYRNNEGVDAFLYGIYEFNTGLTTMLVLPFDDNDMILKRPTNPINISMVVNMSQSEQITQIKLQIDTIVLENNPYLFLHGNNGTMGTSNSNTNNNNEDNQDNEDDQGDGNDIQFDANSYSILKFTQQFQKITYEEDQIIIKKFELINLNMINNGGLGGNGGNSYGFNDGDDSIYFITSGILESSKLGLVLNVETSGFNLPQFRSKLMNYVVMISLCSFVQIFVLIRQMDYTGTQTSAARVSIYTIGIQTILDAYLCLIHLSAGVIMDYLFNAFATASFFQFVTFALFEMRYLLIILKARSPAAFSDGWESLRREISLFYLRFYSCLFGGFILLYYFSGFFHFFLFLMYSYWVPQIYVNSKSSVRKPFLWKYVISISITRLTIPLYFYACPKNTFVQPDTFFANLLIFWSIFQVLVLYLQSRFGPQFFIPARFLPTKYNFYRPISMEIRSREEGQGCVICMCDVEEGSKYMLTECNHLFHEKCLLQWLEFKAQCPTCRAEIVNYIE